MQSGTCVVVWCVIRVQNLDHLSLLFARSSCYCCRLRVPRSEVNNLLLILFLSLSFCCCWFLLRCGDTSRLPLQTTASTSEAQRVSWLESQCATTTTARTGLAVTAVASLSFSLSDAVAAGASFARRERNSAGSARRDANEATRLASASLAQQRDVNTMLLTSLVKMLLLLQARPRSLLLTTSSFARCSSSSSCLEIIF